VRPRRPRTETYRKGYSSRSALGAGNYLTTVTGGGLALPGEGLIYKALASNGLVDTIGISGIIADSSGNGNHLLVSGYTGSVGTSKVIAAPLVKASGAVLKYEADITGLVAFTDFQYIFDFRTADNTSMPFLYTGTNGVLVASAGVTDVVKTAEKITATITLPAQSAVFTMSGRYSLNQGIATGARGRYIKLFDNSDNLLHHWALESSPLSLQKTIYDIVGGVHGTLTGTALPFFTVPKSGSILMGSGFRVVGENYIPAAATTDPLTNQPGKLSGDYCLIYPADTVAMYDLSVLAGVDTTMFLGGEPVGLTPDEWVSMVVDGNLNNCLFLSVAHDAIVGYNPALSDSAAARAKRYLDIP